MRVINLTENSNIYTSNVYFVNGSWNAMEDVNTLVDVGRDSTIIERIDDISSGVGKKRINQVILTHSHYDHASLLSVIKEIYNPVVYAFSPFLEGPRASFHWHLPPRWPTASALRRLPLPRPPLPEPLGPLGCL